MWIGRLTGVRVTMSNDEPPDDITSDEAHEIAAKIAEAEDDLRAIAASGGVYGERAKYALVWLDMYRDYSGGTEDDA